MLSQAQLEDVCMAWNNDFKKCRYLREDDYDSTKSYCLKHRVIEKEKIDKKIDSIVKELMDKGIDPLKQDLPLGDNCAGFPVLKHVSQGYDCVP